MAIDNSIQTLSVDNLLRIFFFLEPIEIITASQTCKLLYQCASLRTVWMDALRRVVTKHGIFGPTFEPMAEHSLAELKHAATSPSRLLALFKTPSVDGLLPELSTRTLEYHTNTANSTPFRLCTLIPGGRFIISTRDHLLELWDLGINSKFMKKPKPIASIESILSASLSCRSTPDDRGIIVILDDSPEIIGPLLRRRYQYRIYEIYPLASPPEFRLIRSTSLEFPLPIISSCCQEELQAFNCLGFIIVWNYVLDTWIKWDTFDEYREIDIFNEHVIATQDSLITFFEIPELHPRTTEEPLTVINPSSNRILLRDGALVSYMMNFPDKFRNSAEYLHLDFLHNLDDYVSTDDLTVIEHFFVQPVDTRMFPMAPKYSLIRSHESVISGFAESNPSSSAFWFSDKEMVAVWTLDKRIVVQVCESPRSKKDAPLRRPTHCLWQSDTVFLQVAQLCPWSGRLCLLDQCHPTEISVVDYLPPPP